MKVTKTSTQPTFQPIELKITIESKEELHNLLELSSLSVDIRAVLDDNSCAECDVAATLEFLLDAIGECLSKGFKGP